MLPAGLAGARPSHLHAQLPDLQFQLLHLGLPLGHHGLQLGHQAAAPLGLTLGLLVLVALGHTCLFLLQAQVAQGLL